MGKKREIRITYIDGHVYYIDRHASDIDFQKQKRQLNELKDQGKIREFKEVV